MRRWGWGVVRGVGGDFGGGGVGGGTEGENGTQYGAMMWGRMCTRGGMSGAALSQGESNLKLGRDGEVVEDWGTPRDGGGLESMEWSRPCPLST